MGGFYPVDGQFLKTLAQICHEQHVLLIVDEIQTGVGRTGKIFAYQHFDLKPDIISLAKGLEMVYQ